MASHTWGVPAMRHQPLPDNTKNQARFAGMPNAWRESAMGAESPSGCLRTGVTASPLRLADHLRPSSRFRRTPHIKGFGPSSVVPGSAYRFPRLSTLRCLTSLHDGTVYYGLG